MQFGSLPTFDGGVAQEGNAMSLDNVRQFQRTAFFIPRYTDKKLVENLAALFQEGGYKVEKSTYNFTFSDQRDMDTSTLRKHFCRPSLERPGASTSSSPAN